MENEVKQKVAHIEDVVLTDLFRVGMLWRIVYGTFKTLLGLALLHFHGLALIEVFSLVMRHEVSEDPHDILVRFIHDWLTHSAHEVTYFLAAYFIFWGLVDIVLSVCLLRRQLWAYPLTGILIGLFILYSCVRYTHTHSTILLGIIVVDIVILALIVREYRRLKQDAHEIPEE